MHINKAKMQLSKTHVLFLGYDVWDGKFSLDSYVAIQQTRLPTISSKTEIRKIMGIFNMCRATCPSLAVALKPLQLALSAAQLPRGLELKKMTKTVWKHVLAKQLKITLIKENEFYSIKVD